jgi:hypothetical protein
MRWHRRFANRVEIEEQTDELLLEAGLALFLLILPWRKDISREKSRFRPAVLHPSPRLKIPRLIFTLVSDP